MLNLEHIQAICRACSFRFKVVQVSYRSEPAREYEGMKSTKGHEASIQL